MKKQKFVSDEDNNIVDEIRIFTKKCILFVNLGLLRVYLVLIVGT